MFRMCNIVNSIFVSISNKLSDNYRKYTDLRSLQQKDRFKESMAKNYGITLITVPFWWNNEIDSIATTIANILHKHRFYTVIFDICLLKGYPSRCCNERTKCSQNKNCFLTQKRTFIKSHRN